MNTAVGIHIQTAAASKKQPINISLPAGVYKTVHDFRQTYWKSHDFVS